MDPIKTQYNKMGDDYAQINRQFFKDGEDPARAFIRSWLTGAEGKTIIDIGCGAGDDIAAYENMGFFAVYGVDPSELMVSRAKSLSKHPERITLGDFEHTGLPDNSVDIVTSRYALHYLVNFDKAYAEVARILKPGGLFVLSVDHPTADAVEGEKFTLNGVPHVRVKLFRGTVTIEFPFHIMSHYISPEFLKHFELLSMEEPIATDREYQDGPNCLMIAARKK
jgi:ubiquinone/menaquinone biosynthesis C-methylase UbiE